MSLSFVVYDVFSKYSWVISLKDTKDETSSKAFHTFLDKITWQR